MRSTIVTSASALIWFASLAQAHSGVHEHLQAIHRRHRIEREVAREANETLVKRGTCDFPTDAGLVAVTPESSNGGWAFAPDQSCSVGRFCPYACPPGQVSMQWDPTVLSYIYPGSRNGGLLCGPGGSVSKPFPNRPYCQQTATNIGVQNNAGDTVAFCQTVLPGDEDMLIPTVVSSWSALAVPDPSYWANTAAHYYINAPGVSSSQGCVWGSTANPWGNWAPYVAGANADSSGQTFIKLGWNPVYLEPATPFRNEMPKFGVKIDCPNGGCNGLPCSIDPSQNQVNEMTGSSSDGAGGGAFCVVTVAKGSTANFVVFEAGGSAASGNQGGQFFQSSSVTPSATTTTAATTSSSHSSSPSSSSSSSSAAAAAAASASSVSSSQQSSTTSSSTSESSNWEAWSSTHSHNTSSTSVPIGPTGQPYYNLFNTSTPAEATSSVSAGPKPTASNAVAIQSHTGSASSIEASLAIIFMGLGAMLL